MSTKNPREAAVRALLAVFGQDAYSNLVLESCLSGLEGRDRSFAAALFYGVLERAVTLDWALSHYSSRPPARLSPAVCQILRAGLYQLLYMPSIPESAVVNEAVKLTRVLGTASASGFVNGVLRACLRADRRYPEPKDPLTALSVRCGVPQPLVVALRRAYGHERAAAFLMHCTEPAPTYIRTNRCRTDPAALAQALAAEGFTAGPVEEFPDALRLSGTNPAASRAFSDGLFHIQDLASQRCAAAVDARPGMRVLDLCAAPGGKSFTIAQQMRNQGILISCDLHAHRAKLIEQGAARLGLTCITPRTADAACYDPALGLFDRVLCDVPCSGYGVIRRKPEIRYKEPASQRELPALQYRILETAVRYLKPDGKLIYSTCTLLPGENESVVQRMLDADPALCLDGEPHTLIPGVDGWEGDGFFYAALCRKSGRNADN